MAGPRSQGYQEVGKEASEAKVKERLGSERSRAGQGVRQGGRGLRLTAKQAV